MLRRQRLDLLGKANITNLTRYLVVLGAIILLAPYAGCHILTTPPPLVDDVPSSRAPVGERRPDRGIAPSEASDERDEPRDQAALPPHQDSGNSPTMDDIETLLQP
jgi:hypothetical protein